MRPVLRSLWQRYLAAEGRGYRPDYLTALSDLLSAVASVDDRDDVAYTALRAYDPHSPYGRLRDPLRTEVLVPFVREHLADPQVLWWAMQTRIADSELLGMYRPYDRVGGDAMAGAITYALAITGEPRWWLRLLDHRLAEVEYGTHHLDEGRGIVDGAVVDCVLQVSAAVAIGNQAPPGVIDEGRREELAQAWSLLRDWLRYDAAGRPGEDFPRWCREQGSEHWVARHTGTRHYYYQS